MKKILFILTLTSCIPKPKEVGYNYYTCEKTIIYFNGSNPVDTSVDYTNYSIKDTAVTRLENTMRRCLESNDTIYFGEKNILISKWIKL